MHERLVFLILIFSRFVDERSVLNNMDEDRSALERLAPERLAPERSDPTNSALLRSAYVRSAYVRSALERLANTKIASEIFTERNTVNERSKKEQ